MRTWGEYSTGLAEICCEAQGTVPYMLTGSLAAAYYATPRATKDIDIVFETDEAGVARLVSRLRGAGLHVDLGAAREALRSHGQFNEIDPESGWKIDLIVRKERAFSRTEFERRGYAAILVSTRRSRASKTC
jgi:hypothetical protein